MAQKNANEEMGITVKKEEDSAEWYSQVCQKAELAEYAPVKGCYIIRPRGYAVWQAVQDYFNKHIIEKRGVKNAYFPLLIPESFFKREAEHAQGFAPEVAWLDKEVTGEGEKLAIRPTSETIMYDSYSRWIRSHRDLPLRINQWCNVVRWETEATKLFLRSREFLWQEGHCAYETKEECDKEARMFLEDYAKLCRELLALPVILGMKTDKEKFAGAFYTTAIESLMPDGKALQCGTSHNLGQGFAKSFGIEFIGKDEQKHLPWQSSWGLSTRLIGAAILTHSDNKGLVLPPAVAMDKIAIIPILFDATKEKVLKKCAELKKKLAKYSPFIDDRDAFNPGYKFNEWEMKGIPLRIEVGPKDIEKKQAVLVRRDTGEKEQVSEKKIPERIKEIFRAMQKEMYEKALARMDSATARPKTIEELKKAVEEKKWARAQWCGSRECEDMIKDSTGAGIRCIPFNEKPSGGCIYCGKNSEKEAYIARSY